MVYIKTAGDMILNLELDPNCTTVKDLKIAIGQSWIIPIILQKLYMLKPFMELELEDGGKFLSQFGITPFSTLLLRGPVVIPDQLRFRAAAVPEKAAADFEEEEEESDDEDYDYDDDLSLSLSLSPMGSSEYKRTDLRMRKRDGKKLKRENNKNKSPEFNMWRHRRADNSIWT